MRVEEKDVMPIGEIMYYVGHCSSEEELGFDPT